MNREQVSKDYLPKGYLLKGHYRIDSVLGQGGFGITYQGTELKSGEKVAIKEYYPVLLAARMSGSSCSGRVYAIEDQAEYERGLERFVLEAGRLFKLSDLPGIVHVTDFFRANQTAYLVMDFVEGITLKKYLNQSGGRLPEKTVLRMMKPLIAALVKIHEAGIIHRDISPENIMLTFQNNDPRALPKEVTLIDFGAARQTQIAENGSGNGHYTVVLKPAYAPEEQYRTNGDQGPWTDVYSVCATLYRCLFGKLPPNAVERMERKHSGKDLCIIPKDDISVSRETKEALESGLALFGKDRTQSARKLYRQLYGRKRKKTGYIVGMLLITILIMTAAGFQSFRFQRSHKEHFEVQGISENRPEESRQETDQDFVRFSGKENREMRPGEAMLLQVESNLDSLEVEYDTDLLNVRWDGSGQNRLRIEAVKAKTPEDTDMKINGGGNSVIKTLPREETCVVVFGNGGKKTEEVRACLYITICCED